MKGENLYMSLESAGFNLISVLDSDDIDDPSLPADCQSVLLIGSAGADLWRQIPAAYFARENPVDDYSIETIESLLRQRMPSGGWQLLYPAQSNGETMPNLQNLGRLAGWHNDSPLGSGIHPDYGLWFAYRAVVVLSQSLQPIGRQFGESPCLSCADAPCISACPASALAVASNPDLASCVEHRVSVDSVCAKNCLARLECPVAPDWRYSDEQINYFYGRSLVSLRQWVAKNSGLPSRD